MHPDLGKLLDLQAKDTALAELDGRVAALGAEVATLDDELKRARDRLEAAERATRDGARRR
ncbi:MAG TPA: hypothetical protein VFU46_14355, partial [Gemmatimonadales bacterium]|nr:hypothetical protein [Gemmatimonadales bacterium]